MHTFRAENFDVEVLSRSLFTVLVTRPHAAAGAAYRYIARAANQEGVHKIRFRGHSILSLALGFVGNCGHFFYIQRRDFKHPSEAVTELTIPEAVS